MARTNGFFGMIQGPFSAQQQVINKIQEDCAKDIDYINKIGICFSGNLINNYQSNSTLTAPFSIYLNGIQFIIGRARQIELQDVRITSIKFSHNVKEDVIIDYQYQ